MAVKIEVMNLKATLAVILISFAPCLASSARAVSFIDFAHLNNDDEAGFIAFLVDAAAQTLKAHGHLTKLIRSSPFFHDTSKNGGVQQLAAHLKTMSGLNNRNATNPNNRAPAYQIEDAMALTLKDDGIIVPASYLLSVANDFRPSGPPRQNTPDSETIYRGYKCAQASSPVF